MSFEYEVTASFNAPNRKHRFNVDETRGTNLAKVDAEYYNEKEQAWRKVRSENTKIRLYDLRGAKEPASSQPVADVRAV